MPFNLYVHTAVFHYPIPLIQIFDAGEGAFFTKIAAIILCISSGGPIDGDGGSRDILTVEQWDAWKQYLLLLPRREELTNLMSFRIAEVSWLQIPELMASPLCTSLV